MGKILGSWSGMRKYLEEEMLAESLKGRVRYSCTTLAGMDHCGLFGIHVDNQTIQQFSMETVASSVYDGGRPVEKWAYWRGFWAEKDNTPLEKRKAFDDMEFAEALRAYRSLSIDESLHSTNPIVRMFAILDRRVGKRTLEKVAGSIGEQQMWLQYFYRLRLNAENIFFDSKN